MGGNSKIKVMNIRLSKVAKELNVGISVLVRFLNDHGVVIESNPNTKIDNTIYKLLIEEFADSDEFAVLEINHKKELLGHKLQIDWDYDENSQLESFLKKMTKVNSLFSEKDKNILALKLTNKGGECVEFHNTLFSDSIEDLIEIIIKKTLDWFFFLEKSGVKLTNGFIPENSFTVSMILNGKKLDTSNNQVPGYYETTAFDPREFYEIIRSMIIRLKEESSALLVDNGDVSKSNEITQLILNDFSSQNDYSDYQLSILCGGMEEAKPRKLARSYIENKFWSIEERATAEFFVEKAREQYGEIILNYCLTLSKKPFGISHVDRLYSRYNNLTDSKIRLINNFGEEFFLHIKNTGFLMTNKRIEHVLNVSRSGVAAISKDAKLEEVRSTLVLFLRFVDDPLSQVVYFGAQTGKCSFCGLPLDDPISLSVGYGKTCAEKNNLLWG